MTTFISSLEYCAARHVHTVFNLSRQEVSLTDYAPWTKIPILDFAEMECADEMDVQRLFETRVTAMLPSRILLPEGPLVFLLTDIYSNQYLLGVPQLCPPFPLVTQTDHAPAKPSDSCLCKIDIRLKSVYPLLTFI